MTSLPARVLFLDVGGVLLTNGWDHAERERAIQHFHLDLNDFNARHEPIFDRYEKGLITLDEYLDQTVFYQPRSFTRDAFRRFLFEQSQPFPDMLDLIREIKARTDLKIAILSNEGREIMDYRIKTFHLTELIDFFVVSCFVHLRKPDLAIYHMALDIAQVAPAEALYVDDRPELVDVGRSLGLTAIHHTDYATTRQALMQRLASGTSGGLS